MPGRSASPGTQHNYHPLAPGMPPPSFTSGPRPPRHHPINLAAAATTVFSKPSFRFPRRGGGGLTPPPSLTTVLYGSSAGAPLGPSEAAALAAAVRRGAYKQRLTTFSGGLGGGGGGRGGSVCSYCRSMGQPRAMVETHSLRNPISRTVICPLLKPKL